MRTVAATRYVTPLREGGSLPALIEADDDGLYVLKFRGAGQGPKALIAELLGGEIARALGLAVPELVLVNLDPVLSRSEPDYEIRSLVKNSGGLNLALDFLPGALGFDAARTDTIDPGVASMIVWLDGFIANVDRTARNTNLILWHRQLWLIDHGAALYYQHDWPQYARNAENPFVPIKDHVLLRSAEDLEGADRQARERLKGGVIDTIVASIPDDWLTASGDPGDAETVRAVHRAFLLKRLESSSVFVTEALRARNTYL
jgi:hypothetical protein